MLTYSPVSSVPLHDALPIYAAVNHKGAPTVILCKTVKGFLMGKWGESQNITHQQKKLDDEALREFRRRVYIDIPDEARSEEHTSELQSAYNIECRLQIDKKK